MRDALDDGEGDRLAETDTCAARDLVAVDVGDAGLDLLAVDVGVAGGLDLLALDDGLGTHTELTQSD